jgi:beta-glucosidase
MTTRTFFIVIAALTISCGKGVEPYKNPNLSISARVKDLIARMTVEEKVGQLRSPYGWEMYERDGDSVRLSDKYREEVGTRHIGMLWALFRADPWTRRDMHSGLNPLLAARLANQMQRYAVDSTRLGIPIFIAEEAPHGHMAIGATVFPTAIGQASTWNPDLIERMGAVIACEVRAQGGHISFCPVLDLARDPRWSRTEESYGEDPLLTSRMGEAFVRGLGSSDISDTNHTIATLKHLAAYGVSTGGQNGGSNVVGERELRSVYLHPFKAAIDAGANSVMTGYNSIDGIPCTANSRLINGILRDEWGFEGFVISDLFSIEGLHGTHNVAESDTEAAIQALAAGVDVDLRGDAFHTLIESVRDGRISEKLLDRAVARVLKLKFEMGLFENPYIDETTVAAKVGSQDNIAVARQVAAESITLLENRNNTLPLSATVGKIAVIGPNADNIYNQLGDYTAEQANSTVTTVLSGIKSRVGASRVVYAQGCAIRDTMSANINEAVRAAREADVSIVVVGGSSARDFTTNYADTGAATVSK